MKVLGKRTWENGVSNDGIVVSERLNKELKRRKKKKRRDKKKRREKNRKLSKKNLGEGGGESEIKTVP